MCSRTARIGERRDRAGELELLRRPWGSRAPGSKLRGFRCSNSESVQAAISGRREEQSDGSLGGFLNFG